MHLNAEYKRVFHYSVDTTTIDKKIIRVRARIMKQHAVKKSALPEVQSKICPTIKISETRESSESSKSSEKKQEDSSSSREQQIIQERHTHLDRLIFNIEKEYEQDPKMVCLNPEIQGKYLISRWENTYVRVPYE